MMIAFLLLACAGCEEEKLPPPPKPPAAVAPVPAPERKPPPSLVDQDRPKPVVREENPKTPPSVVSKALLDPSLPEWSQTAPAEFKVKFSTSKGDFTVLVKREWAPKGADRFYCLVKNGYYDDVRFFRVVEGFMAQFGIHGNPEVNAAWKNATIPDDPVVESNKRGTVSYAMRGPNTRTTQIFVNFDDRNTRLDGMNFAPFGRVIEGMEVVDKLYNGYGEGAPRGRGPSQPRIQSEGNSYLTTNFKELDYVRTAKVLE